MRLLTASDIVIVDSGTKILPHIYDGYNRRESNMNWPRVYKFPDTWQNIFNQVIDNVIRPQLQSTPLSKWTSTSHQQWIHFIDV